MPRAITRPIIEGPPGRHDLDSTPVPVGVTSATFRLGRAALARASVRLDFALELSLDDGQTWLPWGAAATRGGEVRDRSGAPLAESRFRVPLPEPDNPQRRVRGHVTVNEVATTTAMLDFD